MISCGHRTLALWAVALVSPALFAQDAARSEDKAREKAPANAQEDVFYDGFDSGHLDPQKWLVARRQWGGKGNNGGVVPKNVILRDGHVILEAHGDQYQGPVKGVAHSGKDFVETEQGQRVGACIVTKERFASGRYEAWARIPRRLGVCSAFWTFYYDTIAPSPSEPKPANAKQKPRIINHEVDVELPGRPEAAPRNMGYDWALCNTWIGEKAAESTIGRVRLPYAVNDGEFHTYRFDWHTGGDGMAPKVDFFLDDQPLLTTSTHVPSIAGHFWIGVWFPKDWAGQPDFDTETLEIDWTRITPFHEPNDQFTEEPDSSTGFGRVDERTTP
ncbi:MAG: glycoside hydrolase family 16 protein [Candidatus Sumerlaeota bacterium]|nr:glycoside hydrolase family 16 protein [Candidatus Sumerlaeota bacterium]